MTCGQNKKQQQRVRSKGQMCVFKASSCHSYVTLQYNNRVLLEDGYGWRRGGVLPGEGDPEEAQLGDEAHTRSHQMCWHVMITPDCWKVRGLTCGVTPRAGLCTALTARRVLRRLLSSCTSTSLRTTTEACGNTQSQPLKTTLPFTACWLSDGTP